jgi:hypothetical protein
MKRLITAAALVGAAALPAVAGATPPDTQGGPLGSSACTVFASPAPAASSCNFTGASGGIGYMGGSSGGFSLTHVQKVNVCTNGVVTGYAAKTATDESSDASGPFYDGPAYSFAVGRVYTFTVNGVGWGVIGGQSTPAPSAPAEPATPSAANSFAGAENLSTPLGSPC